MAGLQDSYSKSLKLWIGRYRQARDVIRAQEALLDRARDVLAMPAPAEARLNILEELLREGEGR